MTNQEFQNLIRRYLGNELPQTERNETRKLLKAEDVRRRMADPIYASTPIGKFLSEVFSPAPDPTLKAEYLKTIKQLLHGPSRPAHSGKP